MAQTVLEAGIRNQRLDSMLESSGTLPAGGTFIPFSNVVKRFTWSPDAGLEARRGIGSIDALEHDTGLETHSIVVAFLLQGTIAADTPLYEAFIRNSDGILAERTLVERMKKFTGGNDSAGVRTYTVAEGCKPASARIPGDPGQAGPIECEITYTPEKVRQYEIHQPVASASLVVQATGIVAGDGTVVVTLEDDSGNQESATLSASVLSGTTTTSFTSLDAVELSGDITGTLLVIEDSGNAATLVTIYGKQEYANSEGDLGVPVIPASGTRVESLGDGYEKFLGDTITYAGGALAFDINSQELSVDNSVVTQPRNNTRKQRVIEGNRVLQLRATVLGEREYQNQIERHLKSQAANIVWTLSYSTLTLEGAALIDIGDKVVEAGQAYMSLDNTFEGTAISIA